MALVCLCRGNFYWPPHTTILFCSIFLDKIVLDTLKSRYHRSAPLGMETNRLVPLMTLVQLEHGVSLLPEKATLAYHPDACCVSLADIRVPMPIEAMWRPQNTNPCLALFRGFFPSGAHSRER